MIGFGTALKLLPKRGLDISCRISRAEYWWDVLAFVLMNMVIAILTALLPIFGILFLLTFVWSIIATIRRFHDLDKSGWWMLLYLIPGIGGLIIFIMCLLKGTQGPNRFGPDPYAPGVVESALAGIKPMPQAMPQNFQQQGYAQPQGLPQQPGIHQPQYQQDPQPQQPQQGQPSAAAPASQQNNQQQ